MKPPSKTEPETFHPISFASGGRSECAVKGFVEVVGDKPVTGVSPGECVGIKRSNVMGNPDPAHISTSFVERQNPTMRMHMRRFTRLTNAFSKKIDNHACAISLHAMVFSAGATCCRQEARNDHRYQANPRLRHSRTFHGFRGTAPNVT
jgi:hypothetical protein